MARQPRIECGVCGCVVTLKSLEKTHTANHPRCLGTKGWKDMIARDERTCGKDARVLELAGVTRMEQLYYWKWDRREILRSDETHYVYTKREMLKFTAVAPRWAVSLARRLMDDQALVARFGTFHQQKRAEHPWSGWAERQYETDTTKVRGRKKVIPVELRARIIAVAAQSEITRSLFEDDLDAALIIVRDAL